MIRIGIAILSSFFLFSCSRELITGLDENEANRLLVVLAESGIPAGKAPLDTERGTLFRIDVPRRDFLRALQVLKENNLPSEKAQGVMEIFGKNDFLPTQTAERVLEEYSVNSELAKTLEKIQGVLSARVHIARLRDEITGRYIPVSASVLISHVRSENDGLPVGIEDVKKIIAGGVPNLMEEKVNVVLVPVEQKSKKETGKNFQVSRAILIISLGILVLFSAGANLWLFFRFKRLTEINPEGRRNAVDNSCETTQGNG